MVISAIVAASQNGIIGEAGGLPWRLADDLVRFRKITAGHPIIMGRKTHESIGRALPGRQNIIISRDARYYSNGCEVATSLEGALAAADSADEVFIIGGGAIYDLAMPKLDKIYLTEVKTDVDGDTLFKFDKTGWKQTLAEHHKADAKNQFDYEFQVWERQ